MPTKHELESALQSALEQRDQALADLEELSAYVQRLEDASAITRYGMVRRRRATRTRDREIRNRDQQEQIGRFCVVCGESMEYKAPQARTCSARCRTALSRARRSSTVL